MTSQLSAWRVAMVLLLALLALFAWQLLRPEPALLRERTAAAERREVRLPDGSEVMLAANSELVVPKDFGDARRVVRLVGEAWFRVVREGPPFEVQSGVFVIRDEGTAFTVRARPRSPLEVAVLDGSVEVRIAAEDRRLSTLVTGDFGRYHDGGAILNVMHQQPVEQLTSWRTGTLEFSETPVIDVLDRLTDWYGIEVATTPDRAMGKTITASLPVESLPEALAIVSRLLGYEVVETADGLWLQ